MQRRALRRVLERDVPRDSPRLFNRGHRISPQVTSGELARTVDLVAVLLLASPGQHRGRPRLLVRARTTRTGNVRLVVEVLMNWKALKTKTFNLFNTCAELNNKRSSNFLIPYNILNQQIPK